MSIFSGWAARGWGLFSESKGPWGSKPPKKGGNGSGGDKPKGPWKTPEPGPSQPGQSGQFGNVSSLDDWLKRNRSRFGGGGGGGRGPGGFGQPSGSLIVWGILAFLLLIILFTSVHRVLPNERGVVTTFGSYSSTMNPGVGFTLPAPIQNVEKVNVQLIREIAIGQDQQQTLMLTGDENIIDIAYQVRWKIRDPEKYLFELANPEDTVRQVAESAMRQVMAQVNLQDAIGEGRLEIQAQVQQEMQETLNSYDSGIEMRGVEIKRADPPAEVNEAFKEVTAAQQDAQSYINQARAYALELTARAQGEAEAFDKVYEEYRLAPEVTKRRMYYETMESVLQGVDKTIVETPGVTPYLPLNELNRRPRPQAQSGGGQ
ncbi:FtsH protease activity modulator HflK [Sphingomicrobium clamense]|uniref:Protein HflK n=1 Tax=Sphingomicrobium clamense TaxID=2851013 RepID=A0ABS6V461_9SPHN|nr:FtsH protease activity modulator HflK [Sphingomicrobium sp. B8]MBW0144339.1 FtsH protease activity modulator HflK [Sphingomicrobium sp. B8]